MDWEQLICKKRIHGESKEVKKKILDPRSEFEKDVQRIFFSHPFRRLQNKTQLIPIPVFDFIHTRLTHSLEVASVGNTIGKTVGKKIITKNKTFRDFCKKDKITDHDFGFIVQAACLAHDIGNPPFGHSGEDSISDYFNKQDNEYIYRPFFYTKDDDDHETKKLKIRDLTIKHWKDFSSFEGNAMGFRIINNQHYSGFNLTYSTLAAFTKYPRESFIDLNLNDPILSGQKLVQEDNKGLRTSQKKYGFFQSEKGIFRKIADVTDGVGLIELGDNDNYSWCRHPLAFIVEVADDLCNKLIDFEDGFRLGRYDFETTQKLLNSIVKIDINKHPVYTNLEDNNEKICYLRGKVLFILANELSQKFIDLEPKILKGKYDSALIDESDHLDTLRQIDKMIKDGLFKYPPILEIETVGFEVIGGLIHLFLLSVTDDSNLSPKHRDKIKQLLPKQFMVSPKEEGIQKILYNKIQLIIDYIAGMSDTFALQLYRKLKGIDIPRIQNIT